ncbi:hypothetical protein LCGC14_2610820 [marine sediment metagenome]|uniref:Uncharacterized protein n=1 Tax=marine sediment metagenome TaxID=412755 RepID=A0A0F9ATK1_9ZZZZ
MATAHRFNGNIGPNRMSDEQYRQHIEKMFCCETGRKRAVWLASDDNRGFDFSRRVWLQVMGLMETWDIIK